jgi:hypothetical protein
MPSTLKSEWLVHGDQKVSYFLKSIYSVHMCMCVHGVCTHMNACIVQSLSEVYFSDWKVIYELIFLKERLYRCELD